IKTEPEQTEITRPLASVQRDGFTLKALAHFKIEARVLHTKKYWSDAVAKLAPIDLAVGWGPMSDQGVLDRLTITQGNRFFFWEYQNQPPIPTSEIIDHATNMHLIASTGRVGVQIASARAGDLIRM